MVFDRNAMLTADKANSVSELEIQFGKVGLVNGPRNGDDKRSTFSNEAYLARRLIIHLATEGELEFPISVTHQDSPDFIIKHGGEDFYLEVTESSPRKDGCKFSLEEDGKAYPIGDYSEEHSLQPWIDLRTQLQEALNRKRSKSYSNNGEVNLLLYPNSEASSWVALFERGTIPPSFFGLDFSPLKSVFILWKDEIYRLSPTRLKVE
jgi:hypothetical protein